MMKLRSGLRPVWVSLLGSFAVGFSSAHVWASTEIDVTSVTNRIFTDYDEMVSFCDDQIYNVDWLTNRIAQIDGDLDDDLQRINNIIASVDTALYSMEVDGLQGTAAYNALDSARDQLADFEDRHDEFSDTIEDTRTVLLDVRRDINYYARTAPTYQIVVDGYEAPDYSRVLTNIWFAISDVENDLSVYWNWLYNVLYYAGRSLGRSENDDTVGAMLGTRLGHVLSNSWDLVYYLTQYADRGNGIHDVDPVTSGPSYLRQMWNFLLAPYAQLLADPTTLPFPYETWGNPVIDGFQAFYKYPTVWVTNSYQKPLWVSLMTNGIGGSTEHPVYVEVTTGPDNDSVSVNNPVWVAFTNSVHLDSSDVIQVAFTNQAGLAVDFQPLIDAMCDLTNSVWMVEVLNTNAIARAIMDEQQRRIDDLSDDMDDFPEPEEETSTLSSTSFGFVDSVTRSYKEVLTSYKNMFSSIPSDPPADITIWQGGNYGDVEIQSIHWRFSEHATLLRHCRNLFSFGWYMVYVFVVFVTAAIDLCVCGVIVYMVYGLFLGKPEVAYNGMLWCFKTLATFFGYKPQSVK